MTAPAATAAIRSPEQYQVLRRYAQGVDVAAIAADTGLDQALVADVVANLANYNRPFARTLVRAYGHQTSRPPTTNPPPAATAPARLLRRPTVPKPPPATGPNVIATWHGWHCEDCGGRYSQRYDQHGAPTRCGGQLVPVTVTITRRAG